MLLIILLIIHYHFVSFNACKINEHNIDWVLNTFKLNNVFINAVGSWGVYVDKIMINLFVDFIKLICFSELLYSIDLFDFKHGHYLVWVVNCSWHLQRLFYARVSVQIIDFFIIDFKSLQVNSLYFVNVILKKSQVCESKETKLVVFTKDTVCFSWVGISESKEKKILFLVQRVSKHWGHRLLISLLII